MYHCVGPVLDGAVESVHAGGVAGVVGSGQEVGQAGRRTEKQVITSLTYLIAG